MNNYKFLFFVCLFVIFSVKAQINTYSPYSYYGYGVLHSSTNTHNVAMGGMGLSIADNQYLNYLNPASYSFLDKTSFEFGFRTSYIKMSQGNLSQKNFTSGLSNIGLGFPLSSNIGISVALLPYSSVGYDLTTQSNLTTSNNNIQTSYNYKGSGGLNKLLFGFAYSITDGIMNNFSFGTNLNYLFGSIEREVIVFSDNSNLYFRDKQDNISNGLSIEISGLYTKLINTKKSKNYKLNGAFKFSPSSEIKSNRNILQATFAGPIYYPDQASIILQENNVQNNSKFPLTYSLGVSLQDQNNWLIGLDYNAQSAYVNNQEVTISSDIMRNRKEYIIGGFFTPNKDDIYNYFNTIKYRLGVSYASGYLDLGMIHNNESEKLKDFSFSFGFSLPVKKSLSTANLAFKYGVLGSNQNQDSIKENYFNIYLSMTLNEKWFNKRKIQ
jgi:hypothetical protein